VGVPSSNGGREPELQGIGTVSCEATSYDCAVSTNLLSTVSTERRCKGTKSERVREGRFNGVMSGMVRCMWTTGP
jgi:hypothetical protein